MIYDNKNNILLYNFIIYYRFYEQQKKQDLYA